jgi:predicted DNA-binding protein
MTRKNKEKKVKHKKLKEVVQQLKGAVVAHGKQADIVEEHIEDMEGGSMATKIKRTKISGPCKAAAKKKFKVWPSAYASGWGVRCTRAGGPSKMGRSKKKK